jgi:hypothetical protein
MIFWKTLVLVATAAVLSGCASGLLWYGHTPDRSKRLEIVRSRGQSFLVVDSVPGRRFQAIAVGSVASSPDGRRIAYAARAGGRWSVVVDEAVQGSWMGIGSIVFDPAGGLVYTATMGRGWAVVKDGTVGPVFDGLLEGSLRFGADGRLAYVARRADSYLVVEDRKVGEGWDGVSALRFDASGLRLAFVGRRNGSVFLVTGSGIEGPFEAIADFGWMATGEMVSQVRIDGAWHVRVGSEVRGPYEAIGALRLAGDRWAYLARDADGDRLIDPAGRGPLLDAILPSSVVLDPASLRTAYLAHTAAGMVAVIDRRIGPPAEEIRELTFAADGKRVGYIARRDGLDHLVVDERLHHSAARIGDLGFTAAGDPVHVAHEEGGSTIHFGELAFRYDVVVPGTLAVVDGVHWGAVVGSRATRALEYVVDGEGIGKHFEWGELAAALEGRGGHDLASLATDVLREWVAAEVRLRRSASPPAGPGSRRKGH